MSLERKDRVKDQTATTGTGTITLDSVAPTGYRTFASAHTNGATVRYLILDSSGSSWEVGQGVFNSAGPTLTRATIDASSNSGSLVSFTSGLKVVASLPTAREVRQIFYDSNTTNALDYLNGEMQRWAPSGTVTLSITNWPVSGEYGTLLIEGVNLGAATITWPGAINWITSDGSFTTTFSSNGVALQTSGTDFIFLFTRDGGTTIYGKILR
jgi:hypothetical protein